MACQCNCMRNFDAITEAIEAIHEQLKLTSGSDYGSISQTVVSATASRGIARRLAAIPLPGVALDTTLPLAEPPVVQSTGTDLLTLGGVSAALVCLGCALKRKFSQLKQTVREKTGYSLTEVRVEH